MISKTSITRKAQWLCLSECRSRSR